MDPFWFYSVLILLPVAAVSGWFFAKAGPGEYDSNINVHPEYFKGLNHVLNEQPDKAIEVFIKMVEIDSETVETHFALGNLFRRRGEVDRAIRIHQNLIARPALNKEQRSLALLELGMDYMKSGLLDRAEGLFKELIEIDAYATQAFAGLLEIYQQEKDWENAIIVADRLQSNTDFSLNATIAHFNCEIACLHLEKNKNKAAKVFLRRALNSDPNCVRASIIEAEIEYRSGKIKNAIRAYKRVEKQDPDYISEIIQPLHICYSDLDKLDELKLYLSEIFEESGGSSTLLALTRMIDETQGEESAIKTLSSELKKRPTVRGVDQLVEYTVSKANGELLDHLKTIKELTEKLLDGRTSYKCLFCGFDARSLHWQCPGCKKWNTVKPIQGVEGE